VAQVLQADVLNAKFVMLGVHRMERACTIRVPVLQGRTTVFHQEDALSGGRWWCKQRERACLIHGEGCNGLCAFGLLGEEITRGMGRREMVIVDL
jgi:hypothetical protein